MTCAYCKNITVCAICGKGYADAMRKTELQSPIAAEKYDDVLLPFLSLMRKELHANAGKGDRPGWLGMDANTALLEVYWHTAKLSAAVKNNDSPAIMEHSADVANMAMMVLDVCGGIGLIDACSSCGGSGSQGNGPGVGGCTDCLGSGVDPASGALDLAACEAARQSLQKEVWRLRGVALGARVDAAPSLTDSEVEDLATDWFDDGGSETRRAKSLVREVERKVREAYGVMASDGGEL